MTWLKTLREHLGMQHKEKAGGWDLSEINTESTQLHCLQSRFKASRMHQAHKGHAGPRLLKVNIVQYFCRCGIANCSECQCSVQQRLKSPERMSTEQRQKATCSPLVPNPPPNFYALDFALFQAFAFWLPPNTLWLAFGLLLGEDISIFHNNNKKCSVWLRE